MLPEMIAATTRKGIVRVLTLIRGLLMTVGARYNMKTNKLYVGNLSENVTYEQLEELFTEHGEVEEVTRKAGSDYGFVVMSRRSEVERAKQALNGLHLNGRVLVVDEARPQKEDRIRLLKGKRRAGGRSDFHKTGHLEDW
jgi:RNA recognition motif-containing protein